MARFATRGGAAAAAGAPAAGEAARHRHGADPRLRGHEGLGAGVSAPGVGRMLARVSPSALVGALGVLALVATLVPLLAISPYNHSYADDWHYGVWAHLALQETGNVGYALVVALEQAGKAWFDWQGTYSAIFLMAIQPGVFGEQFYVLAAPIVLATLVAGTLFFCRVLLGELLGAERGLWLGVGCAALCVQLLLQPSPVEGIFWYNSAIYYTTYHAAALALVAVLVRICSPWRQTRPRGAVVASVLLAFFVAGGNFVTALVTLEVTLALILGLIVRNRRSAMDVLPAFAVLALGLALSLAAPGNAVRQQTQFPEDSAGVLGTVWHSSLSAFQYLQEWSSGLVLLLVVMSVPVAIYVGGRAAARGWRFRLPGLVFVASVALFATSFTPTFWAEGSVGPGRVQNCRLDLFVVLVLVDVFWLCGWVAARRLAAARVAGAAGTGVAAGGTGAQVVTAGTGAGAGAAGDAGDAPAAGPTPLTAALSLRHVACGFALSLLVACCVVGSMAADDARGEELSSVSAARSVASGQAQAYHEQVLSRLEAIEGSSESSLRVPYYTDVPHVLLMGDIRDNMDNYINYRLCQWYGKDSIVAYRAPATGSGA